MLDRTKPLVEGLVVYPDNLRKNLERTGGLWASEGIMLLLVGKGLARQAAYELVQRNAMRAFAGEGDFMTFLENDPDISAKLTSLEIRNELDLNHALRHADAIVDRALAT
jgi:adenylosuccinate lyase